MAKIGTVAHHWANDLTSTRRLQKMILKTHLQSDHFKISSTLMKRKQRINLIDVRDK